MCYELAICGPDRLGALSSLLPVAHYRLNSWSINPSTAIVSQQIVLLGRHVGIRQRTQRWHRLLDRVEKSVPNSIPEEFSGIDCEPAYRMEFRSRLHI